MSRSPWRSAASYARHSCWADTTSARSRRVRGTEVIGIPSISARSSGWSSIAEWMVSLGRERRCAPATVTSIALRRVSLRFQSMAASRWLSRAPSPPASTAAIQWPLRSSGPTAYTPRWMRRRRPSARRRSMTVGWIPSATSCQRATTPCWRLASRAMRVSSTLTGPRSPLALGGVFEVYVQYGRKSRTPLRVADEGARVARGLKRKARATADIALGARFRRRRQPAEELRRSGRRGEGERWRRA
jgi:hypothetical protein